MHERLHVLTMLAEGNITIEQAADMLDRLYQHDGPQTQEHGAVNDASAQQALPRFTVPELLELAEAGVDVPFLQRVQAAGLTNLSVPQLIAMVEAGADPELMRAVRDAHMTHLTFDDVLELAQAGVDVPFIRSLQSAQLTTLSAAQITEMLEAGIDPTLVGAAFRH